MGVDGSWEQKIDFLKSLGADNTEHTGGTLLEHLIGVHDILKEWNVSEHIQDAGLFHSVYGTTYFKEQITMDRDAVSELIGKDAENLSYLFCMMKKPRLERIMSIKDMFIKKELLLIHQANEDEMNRRTKIVRE